MTKRNEKFSCNDLHTRTHFWEWWNPEILNVQMAIVCDKKIN